MINIVDILLGFRRNKFGGNLKATKKFKKMLEIHFKIPYNDSYFRFFVNSDMWLPPKNAEGVSTAA